MTRRFRFIELHDAALIGDAIHASAIVDDLTHGDRAFYVHITFDGSALDVGPCTSWRDAAGDEYPIRAIDRDAARAAERWVEESDEVLAACRELRSRIVSHLIAECARMDRERAEWLRKVG